jgi:anthranilate synthase component I
VAFGFDGNMDSAITIRSAVLKKKGKKVTAYVQAGAGLVADSVPETEYMESCNKARAVLMAIDQAEKTTAKPIYRQDAKTPRTAKSKGKPKRKRTLKARKGGRS